MDEYFANRLKSAESDYNAVKDLIDFQNQSFLEIGSGNGYKLNFWKRLGAKNVTGVDLCHDAMRDGGKVIRSENVSEDKIANIQADALALPFRNETFNIVAMVDFLEHCRQPRLVLSEAHRVLTASGKIFVVMPHYLGLSGNHLWSFMGSPLWRYFHPHLLMPDWLFKKATYFIAAQKKFPKAGVDWEWDQYKTLNKLRLPDLKKYAQALFSLNRFQIRSPTNRILKWISSFPFLWESHAILHMNKFLSLIFDKPLR